MATVPAALKTFYGGVKHEKPLDFSALLLGAAETLSRSEKDAIEVLHGLSDAATADVKTSGVARSGKALQGKVIQVDAGFPGFGAGVAGDKSGLLATKHDALGQMTALVRAASMTLLPLTQDGALPATAPAPELRRSQSGRRLTATKVAAAAKVADQSQPSVRKTAKKEGKSRYSAFRKASQCPYCKDIGINCGKVAAKCPNRPCNKCGRRHRLNRCRKFGCKHCPGSHPSSKCPIKIKQWAQASVARRREARQRAREDGEGDIDAKMTDSSSLDDGASTTTATFSRTSSLSSESSLGGAPPVVAPVSAPPVAPLLSSVLPPAPALPSPPTLPPAMAPALNPALAPAPAPALAFAPHK